MIQENPLRAETISPPAQRGIKIGWFPYVEAQVSLWFNGRHLKDVSKWTCLDTAVEEATRQATHFGVEPGCGLVVAVTCTWSERIKVWNGNFGWSWPSSCLNLPRPVIKAQRLVLTSDHGFLPSSVGHCIPVRLRFRRRFAITGRQAAEQDLTPLFSTEINPLSDRAMMAGLSHEGLAVSNLLVRNAGPDQKVPGVFWAEAIGESDFLLARNLILEGAEWDSVRNGVLTDFCADHLQIGCYPIENHTHWASNYTGRGDETYWELVHKG